MIPFPKGSNQSNNHPNEAQIASGKGPNLLKHQNTREWRAAEIPLRMVKDASAIKAL